MNYRRQMAAILIFVTWLGLCSACDNDNVAVYKVKMRMLWSEETFPKDYPNLYRPKAQWSKVFGQSHNASYSLYQVGETARDNVREFGQLGKMDHLVMEGDEDPRVYDQFSAPAISVGVGETENMVFVDGGHSLVSMMCKMIPSPDWFIGVDSLDLCVDSSWIDQITLDLEPLDAGAASGLTFTAPIWKTVPPEPVSRHTPRNPGHPAAGFYYPLMKDLPVIAKVELTRVKEYTTKELNDLARNELISKLKKKNILKGLPRQKDLFRNSQEEFTTKNSLDQLMELEEEPVGTPKPNLPDNNVIVVTNAPTTTSPEFDSGIKSMDDVVLAVANGRRLGLNKHLPRHFRSRLHHAVNRLQPNDCIVSEWTDWTPCSATCGFGEKFRTRHIVRERKGDGRACPTLSDRHHCGNVNSCATIDYFEW